MVVVNEEHAPAAMNQLKVKHLTALLRIGLLAGCATEYQPQSFTGGFSDYMQAPDVATVMFHGNGYTTSERVYEMTMLRCAELTLTHGYHYFILIAVTDMSSQSSFTIPGYATTYGSVSGSRNFATLTTNTVSTPPQTFNFNKPAAMVTIKMSNNESSLEPMGRVVDGGMQRPQDAAFLGNSLRQFLGLKR
jgi:hypothetical protein